MRYGTIVKYLADKQFGFIRPDMGRDIFFHISALDTADVTPEITVGQPVKYDLAPRGEERTAAGTASDQTRARSSSEPRRAQRVMLIDKLPGATLDEDRSIRSQRHRHARKKKPSWRR